MSRLPHPSRLSDRLVVRLTLAIQDRDRGDVPGWVLVTVMTAGLVTAIWLVADDQLTNIFTNAVEGVTGP